MKLVSHQLERYRNDGNDIILVTLLNLNDLHTLILLLILCIFFWMLLMINPNIFQSSD